MAGKLIGIRRWLKERILRNRLVQHSLFWALSFYILLRLFAYEVPPSAADWIYTLLFHLSLLFGVYLNLLWLIPAFLQQGRHSMYAAGVLLLLSAATGLNLLTFQFLADWIFPGYYFIAYYTFWEILQFVFIYLVLTSLLKLSKAWFQLQQQQRWLARLEAEKNDAELQALKAQLDPHFLLNSLNSIYSLSLDGDPRIPDILLKVGENMRYILYECIERYVPLERELRHLENYVELQKLRSEDRVKISCSIEGSAQNKQIAPLLFLPLMENAFKHGTTGRRKGAYVVIRLSIRNEELLIQVANSKGKQTVLPVESGGIGLENLRRRLELLYPSDHDLQLKETDEEYLASLQIRLT